MVKNVIVFAPFRSGRSSIARRINKELNLDVICVDEVVAGDTFNFDTNSIIVCMGFAEISPETLFDEFSKMECLTDDVMTMNECERSVAKSKQIRDFAKANYKYFDVSFGSMQKVMDEIIKHVHKEATRKI